CVHPALLPEASTSLLPVPGTKGPDDRLRGARQEVAAQRAGCAARSSLRLRRVRSAFAAGHRLVVAGRVPRLRLDLLAREVALDPVVALRHAKLVQSDHDALLAYAEESAHVDHGEFLAADRVGDDLVDVADLFAGLAHDGLADELVARHALETFARAHRL